MTIEVKLRTAAAANVALQGFLGVSPFRWFDTQLDENNTTFPQVTAQRISTVPYNSMVDPIGNVSRNRMQIRVYSNGAGGGETSRAVAEAVKQFMRTFSATTGTQYANALLSQQSSIEKPEAQPPYFVQLMDFNVFNQEN